MIMGVLPEAQWMRRDDLAALIAALGPEQCRYVGGAVRDTLLGFEARDIDLATMLLPETVMRLLEAADIRAIPTGIAHGTVTAVLPGGNVEITTLRRDVATDGRRATVAFSEDWREDAARRDFTINALYAHPETRAISDYFGGLDDLARRRVRFIGDAETRIREDHLRILRYFRFDTRFGSAPPDPEANAACAALAPMLKGLSRERIAWELLSLLSLPDPAATVERMRDLGVWTEVLPETGPAELAALRTLIEAERRGGVDADPVRRLAALLPADPAMAEGAASRLRLSNAQRRRIATAAGRRPEDARQPRMLAYRLGIEGARDRLLLLGADIDALARWAVPKMPLGGADVIAAGVCAGPKVARTLQEVERRWIAESFPGEQRVRELLAEVLADRADATRVE